MAIFVPILAGLWAVTKAALPWIIASAASTGLQVLANKMVQGEQKLPEQPSPFLNMLGGIASEPDISGGAAPARNMLMQSLTRPVETRPLFGNMVSQTMTGTRRRIPGLEQTLQE